MAKIWWTGQADADMMALDRKIQEKVLEKVSYVARYPEMYPRMAGEKWSGCRKIFIKPHYILVYKVVSSDEAIILYIRDARNRK